MNETHVLDWVHNVALASTKLRECALEEAYKYTDFIIFLFPLLYALTHLFQFLLAGLLRSI